MADHETIFLPLANPPNPLANTLRHNPLAHPNPYTLANALRHRAKYVCIANLMCVHSDVLFRFM